MPVAVRGPLTGDHVHLVVAVQMHFVICATDLFAPLQLLDDVRIAGRGQQRREPIKSGNEAVLDLARRHFARVCVAMAPLPLGVGALNLG